MTTYPPAATARRRPGALVLLAIAQGVLIAAMLAVIYGLAADGSPRRAAPASGPACREALASAREIFAINDDYIAAYTDFITKMSRSDVAGMQAAKDRTDAANQRFAAVIPGFQRHAQECEESR